ncbi:hypothetical protein DQ04_05171030 [Trypanosoma grayi]|uniref:hypothetical protein n=1 Tax=Trypanosoma grayi TaxID=71804 RepID=UPI0004F3FBD3|nr:hypothetical protein DQ04_05171030 [Trypanosoma grayi]KEG09467.1 hypothetical protein DQ04_05171030 [Trypanosoma grayi]
MKEVAAGGKITSVTFQWARAGKMYTLQGSRVVHHGGGESPYRPVVGDLKMAPDQGKFFYEIRTNNDNCKLGVCVADAFQTDNELRNVELGTRYDPSTRNKLPSPTKCWVLNCQTSAVEVNGEERKRLWRLFVPVSGARFGFLVDTNTGVVQLYVNDEYQGILFDETLELKGKALCPCIGLAGMDMNNRNIGAGNKSACVSLAKRCPVGGV